MPDCGRGVQFIAVLKLMQTPDWTERVRATGVDIDDPAVKLADAARTVDTNQQSIILSLAYFYFR